MPRWPKSTEDFDAKIDAIDAKIQRHQEQIDKLEEERSELLSQKRDFEMQELYDFMQGGSLIWWSLPLPPWPKSSQKRSDG